MVMQEWAVVFHQFDLRRLVQEPDRCGKVVVSEPSGLVLSAFIPPD